MENKLKKTDFIPFLDVKTTGATEDWARIDKSTIFSFKANPQTKSMDYISMEAPVEEIDNYIPELPQEIAIYQGNKIYDYMFNLFYNLPTGNACMMPFLMCFGGTDKKAWKANVTVVLGEINTVDGKLTFTLKIGGDIERGTYNITGGKPVFTQAVQVKG